MLPRIHLASIRPPEQELSARPRRVKFNDAKQVHTYTKPERVEPEWVRECKDADSDTEEDEPSEAAAASPAPLLRHVQTYANPDRLVEEPLDSERAERPHTEDSAGAESAEDTETRCDPVAHFIDNLSRQLACTNRTDAAAYLQRLYKNIGTEFADHKKAIKHIPKLLRRVLGREAIHLSGKVMADVYRANFAIITNMPSVQPSEHEHDRELRRQLGVEILNMCSTDALRVELDMPDVTVGDKDALDVIFRMLWLAHRRQRAGASSHLLGHVLVRALVLAHVSANRLVV